MDDLNAGGRRPGDVHHGGGGGVLQMRWHLRSATIAVDRIRDTSLRIASSVYCCASARTSALPDRTERERSVAHVRGSCRTLINMSPGDRTTGNRPRAPWSFTEFGIVRAR
jgi:hypothetical protein